jgi:hypothetical protein
LVELLLIGNESDSFKDCNGLIDCSDIPSTVTACGIGPTECGRRVFELLLIVEMIVEFVDCLSLSESVSVDVSS